VITQAMVDFWTSDEGRACRRDYLRKKRKGIDSVNKITTEDGTEIFYKDWGRGQPVLFSHGWPLNADAWDSQMLFLGMQGYRVIAHDRRSHGRSTQTWDHNDMDTYADDLATLIEALDLMDVVLVGHSTGGGEIARYIGRHGSSRVAKMVLIGAVPPLMLETEGNPDGLPLKVFDSIRKDTADNRAIFFKDLAIPFFGYNRPDAKFSQAVVDAFWLQGMSGGVKGQYDCIREFSEVDYTEDLKKIDVPTLILHGDDDQIVPIEASSLAAAKLIKNHTLIIYRNAPHGLCVTHQDDVNTDLLAFLRT